MIISTEKRIGRMRISRDAQLNLPGQLFAIEKEANM